MHELSIAEGIVAIAERHAAGRAVTRVEVRVGHLRQVVPAALAFAFEVVTHGTPLAGAELEIVPVPAAGVCRSCGARTPLPEFPLTCRTCGGWDVEVTEGEELTVDALELEEELATEGVGR
ncbi:MAG TPA: hydrogenase maturation nickel metallochaperone HypA [Solirubrobacteraceae bacterium]